ncbi:MAG: serine/threonine-protein kinase [Bacteroidota bacterium]
MTGITAEILFDKFEIIEVLKKDEHAAVYLANHVYLSKRIILKVLNTQKISDQSLVERFKREAKLLAKLDHPNIIKVLDFGTHKEYFYISFEYIEGMSLRNLMKTKELTIEQKEKMMIQLMRALYFAHSNQIIHRDIKPENIFIDNNLNVKLGDFGLALSSEDNFVTNPYSIVGTPSYMSPEQVRGTKLTPQSDLFSAGVVLTEIFTGSNPFLKENVSLTLNEIMSFDESEISGELELLPPYIKDILYRLLRKSTANRYNSAKDVLKDLNAEVEFNTVTLNNIQDQKNGSKKKWIFAVIPLVITVSVLIYLLTRTSNVDGNDKLQNQTLQNNQTETSPTINQADQNNEQQQNDNNVSDNISEPLITDSGETAKDTSVSEQTLPVVIRYGSLFVDTRPFAEVYVDGEKIEATPMNRPVSLTEGDHTLKLVSVNKDYPIYSSLINIKRNEITRINVLFDTLMGYINCDIRPYGSIYINNDYKGETPPPLRLIKIKPGPTRLEVKSPGYKDIDTLFNINKGDTLNLRFTLKR